MLVNENLLALAKKLQVLPELASDHLPLLLLLHPIGSEIHLETQIAFHINHTEQPTSAKISSTFIWYLIPLSNHLFL